MLGVFCFSISPAACTLAREERQEDKVDRDSLEQAEMVLNPWYFKFSITMREGQPGTNLSTDMA